MINAMDNGSLKVVVGTSHDSACTVHFYALEAGVCIPRYCRTSLPPSLSNSLFLFLFLSLSLSLSLSPSMLSRMHAYPCLHTGCASVCVARVYMSLRGTRYKERHRHRKTGEAERNGTDRNGTRHPYLENNPPLPYLQPSSTQVRARHHEHNNCSVLVELLCMPLCRKTLKA
jgi:hypothetical protein